MAYRGPQHQGHHEAIAKAVRDLMRALMDDNKLGPTDAMWQAQAVADGAAAMYRYDEMVRLDLLCDPQSQSVYDHVEE